MQQKRNVRRVKLPSSTHAGWWWVNSIFPSSWHRHRISCKNVSRMSKGDTWRLTFGGFVFDCLVHGINRPTLRLWVWVSTGAPFISSLTMCLFVFALSMCPFETAWMRKECVYNSLTNKSYRTKAISECLNPTRKQRLTDWLTGQKQRFTQTFNNILSVRMIPESRLGCQFCV